MPPAEKSSVVEPVPDNAQPFFVEDSDYSVLTVWANGRVPYKDLPRRASIVLMHLDGFTVNEITKKLHANYSTVSDWIFRYKKKGLEGLIARNSREGLCFSVEMFKNFSDIVKGPSPSGRPFWTIREVTSVFGISSLMARRFMGKEGLPTTRNQFFKSVFTGMSAKDFSRLEAWDGSPNGLYEDLIKRVSAAFSLVEDFSNRSIAKYIGLSVDSFARLRLLFNTSRFDTGQGNHRASSCSDISTTVLSAREAEGSGASIRDYTPGLSFQLNSITEHEKEELERMAKGSSDDDSVAIRAQAILKLADGYSLCEIARRFSLNVTSITVWRICYELWGPDGLRRKFLISPKQYKEEELAAKIRKLLGEPVPEGYKAWSIGLLTAVLESRYNTVRQVMYDTYIPTPKKYKYMEIADTVSPDDWNKLERLALDESQTSMVLRKANAVWEFLKGIPLRKTVKKYKVGWNSVLRWASQFQNYGVAGLDFSKSDSPFNTRIHEMPEILLTSILEDREKLKKNFEQLFPYRQLQELDIIIQMAEEESPKIHVGGARAILKLLKVFNIRQIVAKTNISVSLFQRWLLNFIQQGPDGLRQMDILCERLNYSESSQLVLNIMKGTPIRGNKWNVNKVYEVTGLSQLKIAKIFNENGIPRIKVKCRELDIQQTRGEKAKTRIGSAPPTPAVSGIGPSRQPFADGQIWSKGISAICDAGSVGITQNDFGSSDAMMESEIADEESTAGNGYSQDVVPTVAQADVDGVTEMQDVPRQCRPRCLVTREPEDDVNAVPFPAFTLETRTVSDGRSAKVAESGACISERPSMEQWDELAQAILKGTLPTDFQYWDMTWPRGQSLAHFAAKAGMLPKDFSQWSLRDSLGETVAHVVARTGVLPSDFTGWDLALPDGWSVAHEAAQARNLPPGFDRWNITDSRGVTVRQVAERRGHPLDLTPHHREHVLVQDSDYPESQTGQPADIHPPAGFEPVASALSASVPVVPVNDVSEDVLNGHRKVVSDTAPAEQAGPAAGDPLVCHVDLVDLVDPVGHVDPVGQARHEHHGCAVDPGLPVDRKSCGPDGLPACDFPGAREGPNADNSLQTGLDPVLSACSSPVSPMAANDTAEEVSTGHCKDTSGTGPAGKTVETAGDPTVGPVGTANTMHTERHGLAAVPEIPEDLKNSGLYKIAVLVTAAEKNTLPSDFSEWRLRTNDKSTIAHVAAQHGSLPDSFTDWTITSQDGFTVAHMAALHGNLPDSFRDWDIPDSNGWTVAHVAATSGNLPRGFDRWDIANFNSWTVAHQAADCGKLPDGFKAWKLKDENGCTVEDVARAYAAARGLKYRGPKRRR
ncbi:MAG: helix-turn-helix domain-containing protein [Deltaproteobacteria bacterium]|jgi:transposase|nr:helix-turn-helix domain-containing protein [Deltaproteobacteria bacterium]